MLAHTPQPAKSQQEEEEEEEEQVEDQVEEVVVEEDLTCPMTARKSGARFTCFTGTKVQLLTARAHLVTAHLEAREIAELKGRD